MLRRVLRSPMLTNVAGRLKPHQKPEMKVDFVRYPYGHSPVRITGAWIVDHGGYDYGSDALDYEDHSMTMLHQRQVMWRSGWVFITAGASITFWFYVLLEQPFTGTVFGQPDLDLVDNLIKASNDDEEFHDWAALKKQWLEIKAKEEEEE